MTCLTITPASAAEAIAAGAELIVTHHPLPFRPLKRISTDTPEGRLLCDLLAARIAIYSPHTAFDSAAAGINQRLAEGLGLTDIRPLVARPDDPLGAGRIGVVSGGTTLGQMAARLKQFLRVWGKFKRSAKLGKPSGRLPSRAVVPASFFEPARKWAANCLSPARSASILAWQPRLRAWPCCWPAILPANASASKRWPTCWQASSRRFRFGPAVRNAIR